MLFHHKTHKIKTKDVLSNTKLNDTKKLKFSPENHLFYFADNSYLRKLQNIYIIVKHTRCRRGKIGTKFKIFNNKSIEKKIKIIQEFISENAFYFTNYSISIYTSHTFFAST